MKGRNGFQGLDYHKKKELYSMDMEEFVKKGYKTFSRMLSKEDFIKYINRMGKIEKNNFLKASLMYQRALRCSDCDPDVCIALLCSTIEMVSGGGS